MTSLSNGIFVLILTEKYPTTLKENSTDIIFEYYFNASIDMVNSKDKHYTFYFIHIKDLVFLLKIPSVSLAV